MSASQGTDRKGSGRRVHRVQVLRRARRRARFRESLVALGPKSRRITLSDGRALGFDEFGDPGGTPILLFHGFGSSRVVRHPDDEIATELGARVIAVDRPGIGLSERQPNRRLTDWPRDMRELLDVLGIERCAVIAWSGGGPYALACAWRMPQRFGVLGLIACPAPIGGVAEGNSHIWPRHRIISRAADH
ncbi:MAG: alpha/beta fold hydrolase, partial [Chloroflexota bacterium]